ncbi:MAG: MFS transporter [Myxococcales bacterium]|nr:MFS transporter [Myxococcales bacterium]
MPPWVSSLASLGLLLVAVVVVLWRLPKVELGHSNEFKRRRFLNWFPLGMTYAFLYFGRYNLGAVQPELEKLGLLTKQAFGDLDAIGAIVYGVAFLINGPLTDKYGGRVTILIAAIGSAAANVFMGLQFQSALEGGSSKEGLYATLVFANAVNMYFQSFGAVSIVKVNAPWFHTRERGVLGGVFGILISLGLYFAYDWTPALFKSIGSVPPLFFIPAAVLAVFFVIDFVLIRDTPGDAGHKDFDTGDASYDDSAVPSLVTIAKRMFSQKVIWIIVAIEFCSGFLRQAVMKWGRAYAKDTGALGDFVFSHWGLTTCIAGILGGVFAGFISDHVFGSRRGPVVSVLYGGLLGGALVAVMVLGSPAIGWAVAFMSLCVIGVHGMLSGTASADFGGKKGAGMATGIIDGFVYLGTATQAFVYGRILPKNELAKDPANWVSWPVAMIPVAVLGLLLASRVWNARPKAAGAGH